MKIVTVNAKLLRGPKLGTIKTTLLFEITEKDNVIMYLGGKFKLQLTLKQLHKMQLGVSNFVGEKTRTKKLSYRSNKAN